MLPIILCLLAADSEPAPAMKALASGPWRHAAVNGKQALVIRKPEDLVNLMPYSNLDAPPAAVGKNAARDLAEDLKVKEIDWSKQMVLILLAGEKPSGGFSIEVTGMKVSKGTLTVTWKLHEPKGAADTVITYPNLAVLVPRFAGKVVLDPPLGK
jgi:hypothetical protein